MLGRKRGPSLDRQHQYQLAGQFGEAITLLDTYSQGISESLTYGAKALPFHVQLSIEANAE